MIGNTRYSLLALVAVLLIVTAGAVFAQGGSGGGLSPAAAVAPAGPPKIDVHGYMQNRFYAGPGANPEFRSERISISTLATFADNNTAYVEVYYHPWAPASGLYLESAYYDRAVGDGHLRIGKGRRQTFGITPAYPNRKTSNYGIVSEAFTQDRIQGIQYYIKKGAMDSGISVHTAYRLGTRAVGEIPGDSVRNANHQVAHLSLRDDSSAGLSRKLQVSGRLGGSWQNGLLKAGLSASFASLDPRDVANLTVAGATNPLSPVDPRTGVASPALLAPNGDDNMSQWGVDFMKRWQSGFVLQGEFYGASVSALDYNAWDVLGGYEWANGWKAFVRYSQQNMDTTPTTNPLSWDLRQTSISVVQPIAKSIWLQYEYEINGEKTDNGGVSNNLFFVELFTGF